MTSKLEFWTQNNYIFLSFTVMQLNGPQNKQHKVVYIYAPELRDESFATSKTLALKLMIPIRYPT